jgi:TonB family protein
VERGEYEQRQPSRIGQGVATSLFIHGGLLFPLVTLAFIFGAREQARRESEIEMTFEEVAPEDLPADLPPIDPEALEPKPAPRLALEPKPAEPEPAPQPEQPPPPPEQEKPPAPKPPEKHAHEKSVDFHIDKEEEPSPEAKFLAEKSNRVEEETRADRTNLEKEQQGQESSSPSQNQAPETGDDEDKVARLEDVKSKRGRSAPDETPHVNQSLQPSPEQDRRSLLSMRETAPMKHETSPETVDPALPRDADGIREMPEESLQSMKDMPGRTGQAPRTSLRLSGKQYEYLFGDDAEAAAGVAPTERSKKRGRFAVRQDQIKAALENFIPEVKPGNQTALNTRAAPFAAFIARMHRSIHEYWGFGFLQDLESKSYGDPMNSRDLVTRLEIVLNGDGTVAKVTVIRPSGVLGFDVAAIDVVYTAAPFPDPPRSIRSANGKIYVHWSFHRDERQCATSHTDYFILDNPPADGDVAEGPAVPEPGGGGSTPGGLKRLERGLPGEGPPPGGGGGGGRRRGGPRESAAAEMPAPDNAASRRAERQRANPDDPAARSAAERWFEAYVRGDVNALVRESVFPFKSREGVAARSASELGALVRDLLSEAPAQRRLDGLVLQAAAGVRGMLGGLPDGFGDGQGLLFAIGRVHGDTFVLVLSRQTGGWKAGGLVRI